MVGAKRRSLGLRLLLSCAILGPAAGLLAVGALNYSYGCIGTIPACVSGTGLQVAESSSPGAVWYDATHPPPPLTNQITQVAGNLYPGRSASMVAFVKNTRSAAGTPTIGITSLVDTGGAWTPSERVLESVRDNGDLSRSIDVTITYASSLSPSISYVAARGTLYEIASRTSRVAAPVRLSPYSNASRDIGMWRITLSVPVTADDRIQGDKTSCTVVFGLVQAVTHHGRDEHR